ncbi:uncharacterized protein LOC142973859 [Anticarsia gemmatalis]|uniref:uncharacterized protein LOC142973859 n=1 Tax=Anticarsia gemmatalis TaxID=129554 RepID=UPI003F7684F5
MNKLIVSLFLLALYESVTCEDNLSVQPLRTFKMPESCKSEGREFCFDNAEYPIDIVEELLKDMNRLEVAHEDDVGKIQFSDRQGSPIDEPDCLSQSTNKPIYYIVDEAGKDRVVVQLNNRFQQRYSVNWCDKEGPTTKTKHFLTFTLDEYKPYCKNQYMRYDFLVLSSKPDSNGKWHMERAQTKTGIPVCCVCKYNKDD